MKLIDLSHSFEAVMPIYPHDQPVSLEQTRFVEAHGFNYYILTTGLHAGTHMDAPLHFLQNGNTIKDIALDTFMGLGCLLDVRGEKCITYKRQYDELVSPGDIVLLRTDHSVLYGKEEYFTCHPVVSENLADFFIERKIRMLGLDLPSPDQAPFSIHHKLLIEGIPLLENLTNLCELSSATSFEIMAFPLKIGAEACPVRVVAKTLA